ncbi:MAG: amino acid ABC transporter substrate-binding protein [Acidimicrobiia bacterium]
MSADHRWSLIPVLALLLAACATQGSPETTQAATSGDGAAPEGDAITIAASLPLTGGFSVPGQKHQEGFQLCVDLINEGGGLLGRPVELLVSDNRSDTETVVNQYERFINVDNAELILGTFSSLLTFPSSVISEQAQKVYISPSDGSLVSFSRDFQFLFDIQQSARQFIGQTPVDAIQYYREQGVIPEGDLQTVAVVNADDFFANIITSGLLGEEVDIPGGDPVDLAPGSLSDSGLEVVFRETWPEGFTDWTGIASRLKEADADALFTQVASDTDGLDLIRGLQVADYQPKFVYMSTGTADEFRDDLQGAADGVTMHTAWHATATWEGVLNGEAFSNADFIAQFEDLYGRTPNEDEAIPFAACQVLEQGVRAVGSTDNVAIRDWLAGRTADDPARTILGDLYWDERGLVQGRHFLLAQWQGDELGFVFPPEDFEVSELAYPKPEW